MPDTSINYDDCDGCNHDIVSFLICSLRVYERAKNWIENVSLVIRGVRRMSTVSKFKTCGNTGKKMRLILKALARIRKHRSKNREGMFYNT